MTGLRGLKAEKRGRAGLPGQFSCRTSPPQRHDGVVLSGGGGGPVLGFLQTSVQVEGKHLQTGLQRVSVFWRFLLTPRQQDLFERIALYCDQFTNTSYIPVLFVLGFYVTLAFNRWWGQYTSFPLPDNLMMVVGRLLRRTLMRYANLSSVLILRSISTRVHRRFPTMQHIVEAGFMMPQELKLFDSLHSDYNKYWMPLTWFSNVASRAREEGE
ncbi:hypothetical protein WMY93_000710 [Mugilogobius chulae]|uniref:Bestrophin homolog n=1 Tax=Mugilogobius chulae TaxID=88201 RepID=A0AAW0QAQ2_9GOBI